MITGLAKHCGSSYQALAFKQIVGLAVGGIVQGEEIAQIVGGELVCTCLLLLVLLNISAPTDPDLYVSIMCLEKQLNILAQPDLCHLTLMYTLRRWPSRWMRAMACKSTLMRGSRNDIM
ncbi:hypothetical protein BC938DRAFT_479273 [Jimgerdemannia flammicorona]|uniref:Uncharacterized protein n=1 Tax=Jimgerdemannia flammicorona TaxID=994334 RepID=A0A433QL75_9FUNG|nr:hypothetical protein BC938DRAFT_479273 [Jimgerdemannia flammicorona]